MGYQGPALVVVSCVTDEKPYKAHPHNLVGRSCNEGVYSQEINTDNMTAEFTHLRIQCVTKAGSKSIAWIIWSTKVSDTYFSNVSTYFSIQKYVKALLLLNLTLLKCTYCIALQ